MSEKLWHLAECRLFEHLSEPQLAELEAQALLRSIPPGSPIYLPIDQADGVLLLTSGRAKICSITAEGKQAILAFIEPGELFGELALFEDGQREEFAEAILPSQVVLIPREAMQQLMEANPQVSLGVTKLMGLRRRRVERRLKSLLFRSNRSRLVHLLVDLVEQYGRESEEGVELAIRLSHQDLASIIGSTRESVTVLLNELQGERLLRLGRRRIVLLDVPRLAASVDLAPPRLGAAPDV